MHLLHGPAGPHHGALEAGQARRVGQAQARRHRHRDHRPRRPRASRTDLFCRRRRQGVCAAGRDRHADRRQAHRAPPRRGEARGRRERGGGAGRLCGPDPAQQDGPRLGGGPAPRREAAQVDQLAGARPALHQGGGVARLGPRHRRLRPEARHRDGPRVPQHRRRARARQQRQQHLDHPARQRRPRARPKVGRPAAAGEGRADLPHEGGPLHLQRRREVRLPGRAHALSWKLRRQVGGWRAAREQASLHRQEPGREGAARRLQRLHRHARGAREADQDASLRDGHQGGVQDGRRVGQGRGGRPHVP
mmetsp:Transcript_2464/g.7349  ORF Transcript_2464/g.7349 Transcript_2464/m.7349 type:complete len:306 (+) Transcript_2464:291-1208(+)